MKKFFATILVLGLMFFYANCQAATNYNSVPITQLKNIVGSWYDTEGNLILTISNDYKLNGHQITSVGFMGDTVAMYKIVFNDGNQSKYIEVTNAGNNERSSYHNILVVTLANRNAAVALRRTKDPQYVESIGGIYLGMDKDQVLRLYGKPSEVTSNRTASTWTYSNSGFKVHFEWNVVTGITIYSYGDRKFDGSGLSARSSASDFAYKYNTEVNRRGNLNIGHGELIRIDKDSVYLGILTLGYSF